MKKCTLILMLLLLSTKLFAYCVFNCNVQYERKEQQSDDIQTMSGRYFQQLPVFGGGQTTTDSWSNVYTVTVYFYSGYEYDITTSSNDYDYNSVIALIAWSNGGYSTIELSSIQCNVKYLSASAFNGYHGSELSGTDTEQREWKILVN